MGKKLKIVIIVVVVIVVLFFIAALASRPYINKDVSAIQGIGDFVVLEQGSQYVARFSLADNEMGAAAADVNVDFRVGNYYEGNFNVSADDFGMYQLQLTGQEFVAYAWTLPNDFSVLGTSDTAVVTVTLPDGREFTADTTVF